MTPLRRLIGCQITTFTRGKLHGRATHQSIYFLSLISMKVIWHHSDAIWTHFMTYGVSNYNLKMEDNGEKIILTELELKRSIGIRENGIL